MNKLGKSLQKGSSNGKTGGVDIQQTLDSLNAEWSTLDKLWNSRKQRLEQGVELQRLNQEGDRIEAALSGHEARLRVNDVGVRTPHPDRYISIHVSDSINVLYFDNTRLLAQDSVDSVHSLLGRQEELEGLLKALDLKVDRFTERCQELINQQHYAAKQ